MPGIRISEMTMSKGCSANRSSASRPQVANVASHSPCIEAIAIRSMRSTMSSSSTNKIRSLPDGVLGPLLAAEGSGVVLMFLRVPHPELVPRLATPFHRHNRKLFVLAPLEQLQ